MTTRGEMSWVLFSLLIVGVLLLMVGVRPELQPRLGNEEAPGPTIGLIGHGLTWATASVLTFRMIRGARTALAAEAGGRPQRPSGPA